VPLLLISIAPLLKGEKHMIWVPLNRTLDIPLTKQIYEQLRERILNNDLKAGQRLASTRQLSNELKVSRNIVLDAYEQLYAEGFIEGLHGSGTYVAEGASLKQGKDIELPTLSVNNSNLHQEEGVVNFRSGIPALDLFPRKVWGTLAKRICSETSHNSFGYDSPEGRLELREVLSEYLLRMRGVRCHPDQLVITSGATQGLSLVAKLLTSPNDEVIIEDPITHEIQTIFQSQGASLYPVPVDQDGMMTNKLPLNRKPSFIFVTPSHQFPLGGTLPIQRRIKLIEFARNNDCFIVEDDYDSEFRYEGSPISSLQGLDQDRTIYIGTFSKILSPALRLGYLILPPNLIEKCRNLKWFSDLHTPSLDQLILADFIKEGYLERHILKMKKIYKKKRDVLKIFLNATFRDAVDIYGDSTGLHIVVRFKGISFTDKLLNELKKNKVKVYPVKLHTMKKGGYNDCLILGYGNLSEEQIERGIMKIKEVLYKN
jgi:GntR family transcriptional regulator/MocR family aminotransferase